MNQFHYHRAMQIVAEVAEAWEYLWDCPECDMRNVVSELGQRAQKLMADIHAEDANQGGEK